MKKYPLKVYVIAVVIVLIILNLLVWYLRGSAESTVVMTFSAGFLLGMLAMYIAVHVYKWK